MLPSQTNNDPCIRNVRLVYWYNLSAHQAHYLHCSCADLDGGMIKSVLSGETASPLTAIAHLKQLCGHPSLVREDRATVTDDRPANILLEESAKLQVLYSLMQRLKRAGHRALIFSQSTKMLDIMERVFDGSFTYLRIDGQSAEKSRQRNVDDFNDMDSGIDCMLLSTKAAGVGLTLNGANRGKRIVLYLKWFLLHLHFFFSRYDYACFFGNYDFLLQQSYSIPLGTQLRMLKPLIGVIVLVSRRTLLYIE